MITTSKMETTWGEEYTEGLEEGMHQKERFLVPKKCVSIGHFQSPGCDQTVVGEHPNAIRMLLYRDQAGKRYAPRRLLIPSDSCFFRIATLLSTARCGDQRQVPFDLGVRCCFAFTDVHSHSFTVNRRTRRPCLLIKSPFPRLDPLHPRHRPNPVRRQFLPLKGALDWWLGWEVNLPLGKIRRPAHQFHWEGTAGRLCSWPRAVLASIRG